MLFLEVSVLPLGTLTALTGLSLSLRVSGASQAAYLLSAETFFSEIEFCGFLGTEDFYELLGIACHHIFLGLTGLGIIFQEFVDFGIALVFINCKSEILEFLVYRLAGFLLLSLGLVVNRPESLGLFAGKFKLGRNISYPLGFHLFPLLSMMLGAVSLPSLGGLSHRTHCECSYCQKS